MKFIKFLVVGMLFGIVMAKSQALSWYRIQEMFRFQSFHMYGIIGTAVVLGVIGTALIKKYQWKDYHGDICWVEAYLDSDGRSVELVLDQWSLTLDMVT
jgi:D-alanyl-lipoteichoic acid acyltransferase DltB (MBOAT superfamily)